MNQIKTNRDLYLAITDLTNARVDSQPSLESYLITLRQLGSRWEQHGSIAIGDFYSLIRDSFSVGPEPFDDAWVNEYASDTDQSGFQGWRSTITSQIVDLHEMAQSGALQNEMRYFGIQAPRGGHWVNFDPCTFLECAMAGTIGGWEPDDDSGRSLVPGPVAVLDENNNIVTVNPEDVPRPIYPLPFLTWELFRDFLESGQQYE